MVAIATLLVTLTISLLITRIAAVALKLTGLSEEVSNFQARSAFTGCGYTTAEADQIINHPVRRKIVSLLMIMGNLGVAAVVASTMAAFTSWGGAGNNGWREILYSSAVLCLGLLTIWYLGTRAWVDRTIGRVIEWALVKFTKLDTRDFISLLRLADGYVVLERQVKEEDWVNRKTLSQARLSDEGILVLGLHRANGTYLGSPNGLTEIHDGDVLTVYGRIERLNELDLRKVGREGDRAHEIAVKSQKEMAQAEAKRDTETPPATEE